MPKFTGKFNENTPSGYVSKDRSITNNTNFGTDTYSNIAKQMMSEGHNYDNFDKFKDQMAYDYAVQLARSEKGGDYGSDEELKENIDKHYNNILNAANQQPGNQYDWNSARSGDELRTQFGGVSKDSPASWLKNFNEWVGGGIKDVITDPTINTVNGVANLFAGKDWGEKSDWAEGTKNFLNKETLSVIPSIAEDVALAAASPFTGGATAGLLVGKNLLESAPDIMNGLSDKDAITGVKKDLGEQALQTSSSLLPAALSALPFIGKAGKIGGKAAKVARVADEGADIEKILSGTTKAEEGLKIAEKETDTASDILDKFPDKRTKAAKKWDNELLNKEANEIAARDAVNEAKELIPNTSGGSLNPFEGSIQNVEDRVASSKLNPKNWSLGELSPKKAAQHQKTYDKMMQDLGGTGLYGEQVATDTAEAAAKAAPETEESVLSDQAKRFSGNERKAQNNAEPILQARESLEKLSLDPANATAQDVKNASNLIKTWGAANNLNAKEMENLANQVINNADLAENFSKEVEKLAGGNFNKVGNNGNIFSKVAADTRNAKRGLDAKGKAGQFVRDYNTFARGGRVYKGKDKGAEALVNRLSKNIAIYGGAPIIQSAANNQDFSPEAYSQNLLGSILSGLLLKRAGSRVMSNAAAHSTKGLSNFGRFSASGGGAFDALRLGALADAINHKSNVAKLNNEDNKYNSLSKWMVNQAMPYYNEQYKAINPAYGRGI